EEGTQGRPKWKIHPRWWVRSVSDVALRARIEAAQGPNLAAYVAQPAAADHHAHRAQGSEQESAARAGEVQRGRRCRQTTMMRPVSSPVSSKQLAVSSKQLPVLSRPAADPSAAAPVNAFREVRWQRFPRKLLKLSLRMKA